MQTRSLTKFTVVNLDGLRIMGAPSRPSQRELLDHRVAQRERLDLPPIRA